MKNHGYVMSMHAGTSLCSVALIAFDRYVSIVLDKPMSWKGSTFSLLLSWFIPNFLSSIQFLGDPPFQQSSDLYCLTNEKSTKAVNLAVTISMLVLMTICMGSVSFSYASIYLKVKSIRKQSEIQKTIINTLNIPNYTSEENRIEFNDFETTSSQKTIGEEGNNLEQLNKIETLLLRKSILITAVFSANFTPFFVASLSSLYSKEDFSPFVGAFSVYLIILNSLLNPLIFIFTDKRFSNTAKEIFCFKKES
ncbi:hypothetical protein HDU92_007589 [Lobulomyces angularis]|nr:hypothetical protein HDU92_007589 [Lobulomyces angularis]